MLQRHVKKKSSLLTPPLPPPDLPVPANEKLLAWVGDEIEPRESAKKHKGSGSAPGDDNHAGDDDDNHNADV
ncbi:hypothetical protein K1719_006365 [Acacia pycnantha]|nr:hypothetical protein K1719_006365 [Acacia pycnantha]